MPFSFGRDRVLMVGATGYMAKPLVRALRAMGVTVRLFVHTGRTVEDRLKYVDRVEGDLATGGGVRASLEGVHTAYYMAHSLGGSSYLKCRKLSSAQLQGATNFINAANAAGLKRIIYMGFLGDICNPASALMAERAEVARILGSGSPTLTVLRSSIVLGAGASSFEMLRYLVERLPLMLTPAWADTRLRPIYVQDALEYLTGCLIHPETAGRSFSMEGQEDISYRDLIKEYTRIREIAPRVVVRLPINMTLTSPYWVSMITPLGAGVAHTLMEGLSGGNLIGQEPPIGSWVEVERTPLQTGLKLALAEETHGPGVSGH